jgi:hypothetical protein
MEEQSDHDRHGDNPLPSACALSEFCNANNHERHIQKNWTDIKPGWRRNQQPTGKHCAQCGDGSDGGTNSIAACGPIKSKVASHNVENAVDLDRQKFIVQNKAAE